MSLQITQNRLARIKQLMHQGAFDIAQFESAKCLLDDEFNVEIRLIMSRLCDRAGKYQSAVQYALQAEKLLTGSSDWHEVLAVSGQLANLGEEQAAFACLGLISIDLDKNLPGATEIAKQYQILEGYEQALNWLALAEAHRVNLPQVTELRGLIHMFNGDLASSEIELEKSIVEHENPGITPHILLSMLGSNADARIDRLKTLHGNSRFPPQEQSFLNYALFKELDSTGQVDQAWEYLSTASALRRKEVSYSSELENIAFDELIAATKDFAIGGDSSSKDTATPIFIIGMPRSGTSLLESVLANDDGIAACGELTVVHSQLQFVLNRKIRNPFDLEMIKALPGLDYAQWGRRYLEKANWKTGGKPFFIDKNPGNFNYAGLIAKALPFAKIINLVRHPVDVCFSNLKEVFVPSYYPYSYTQEECANHYKNYKRLMAHWHQVAPGRILDVAYENLVSQPAVELQRVQKFCGLAANPYQTKSRNTAHVSNSASTVQLREPVHKRNINGWRRYEKHLAAMEELLQSDCDEYVRNFLV
ncbi:MAG: tetratricopeptide repeat-containing sulfotransferase family protein [Arenimonas sp.]